MIGVMLDTLVVGAGPAGLTAYLYAVMYGLTAVCIGDLIGGKLVQAPKLIDYPGVAESSGMSLVENILIQLGKFQAKPLLDEITDIITSGTQSLEYSVLTKGGQKFGSRTLIFATGNANRQRENRMLTLAAKLNLAVEAGFLTTNEKLQTNRPGIFAAGDCVRYPDSLEQLVTSVATGAKAAVSVYEHLKNSSPPILWGQSKIRRI